MAAPGITWGRQMAKKSKGGKFPWLLAGAGVGALALFGMAANAKAEATPLEPWEDPALTQKEAAQKMSDELHAILANKGFKTFDVYVTAQSKTEGIAPVTGTRNLVAEDQAGYEKWYGFMWPTHALLTFNNFGSDGMTWADYIARYQAAKAYVLGL